MLADLGLVAAILTSIYRHFQGKFRTTAMLDYSLNTYKYFSEMASLVRLTALRCARRWFDPLQGGAAMSVRGMSGDHTGAPPTTTLGGAFKVPV